MDLESGVGGFGLIVFGDGLPDDLEQVRNLIAHEPEVYEEFDIVG